MSTKAAIDKLAQAVEILAFHVANEIGTDAACRVMELAVEARTEADGEPE